MKSSVYEGNKRALVATIMLIVLLFAASYAYFSSFNTANLAYNLSVGEMANVTLAFTDGMEMSMTVDPLELTDQTNKTVSGSTSTAAVTLNNFSEYKNIACKYEIWYDPITIFEKSEGNTSNAMEYGIKITSGSTIKDINLTGVNKPTKLYETTIADANATGARTVTWSFATMFNSMASLDQSEHMGKSYNGRVYFKSAGCEEAKVLSETLSDKVLAKVSDTEYTSAQDRTPYLVKHETVEYNGTTYDAGVRYEGNDPDNYVTFNGNEEWRIIGVFEGSTIGLEPGKQYTKIIRNTPMYKAWDVCTNFDEGEWVCVDGTAENDWVNSTLNTYLNNDYLNGNGQIIEDDGDSVVIKSLLSTAKSMIAQYNGNYSTWYIRGMNGETHEGENAYTPDWYLTERITGSPAPNAEASTTGAIGLMYPSDYGYGAYGSNCDNKTSMILYNYETGCAEVDWLLLEDDYEWLISPYPDASYIAFSVSGFGGGYVNAENNVNDEWAARPVLYLEASVGIDTGEGTKALPYVLK